MCGIAGFVDPTTPNMDGALRSMLDCMIHRGPDGEGKYLAQELHLALGMRRLSIIDLETGGQPIWNEDHTVCVVCNGEIYNYLELGRELRKRGHHFRTRSDTEVLVHLYEDFGEQMTSRLRGMFAFCIFDARTRALFLARDHFGQKPLYFTIGAGRFAFASELKALLVLPWVNRDLDSAAFLDYATWLSLPPPRTHFRHIRKLPAGYSLRIPIDAPTAEPRRYWHYDLSAKPDLTEPDIAVTELDRALNESVSLHLRADVPIGVLLSSGLDSRTVLAYAQALQNGIQSFSVGFGAADSELVGAAETARKLGSEHRQLELTASDFAEDIDRVAALLDEPVGDPACFAVLRVCELARNHVKVLLSGEGSDEFFAGYDGRYIGMLATMERNRRLRWFARFLPKARVHASASRWERLLARAHSSPGSEVVMLRVEGLPGDVRAPRGLTSAQLEALPARMHALAEAAFCPQRDGLSSLLDVDIHWQLPESLLQKADKMSMGASVELRAPIVDIEVAKVAARIPSSLKLLPNGPGKYVLRQTLARKLDEPICNFPKKGFPVPLGEWFRGPLRQLVEDDLFEANSFISTHLDRTLLHVAWNDFMAGWDGGRAFFALWLYERWCRAILK
jgi:asparagine synthase (glutamine-hydrolysing)